jgi:phosphoribosylaminoimidazole-succinocarboxamide synthase
VRKAQRIDIECIVRGYLAGSAWDEYRRQGTVNGQKMPAGLQESQELPEPLFTPTTKAEEGHDQPITFEQMVEMVGQRAATAMRLRSLALYRYARDYARERGIIIADTKFEFGLDQDGQVVLADEVLTPDSSRFWPADAWQPGSSPPSFDKQFVRDWLEQTGWDKRPPAPSLPADVIAGTAARYREAFERLTGHPLDTWLAEAREGA